MRLSDYIFERISKIGVDSVFLVTGRGSLFLTDAVVKIKALDTFACITNNQLPMRQMLMLN